MNELLTNYGWDGEGDFLLDTGTVMFSTEGLLHNKKTHLVAGSVGGPEDPTQKTIEIQASFLYQGLDIGLVLWYNDLVGYLVFRVNEGNAYLERTLYGKQVTLSRAELESEIRPETGQIINLKATLYSTNIKAYLNETLVIDTEQQSYSQGSFGIMGSQGEECQHFFVKTNVAENWTLTEVEGSSIFQQDGDTVIQIDQTSLASPSISQTLAVPVSGDLSFSLDYEGAPVLRVYDTLEVLLVEHQFPYSETRTRGSFSWETLETEVVVQFTALQTGIHIISRPQAENKVFSTSYTVSSREDSFLTFPSKNFNRYQGGAAFSFRLNHDFELGRQPLLTYGFNFSLYYENEELVFLYDGDMAVVAKPLLTDREYFLMAKWNNKTGISLGIIDGETTTFSSATLTGGMDPAYADRFYLGSDQVGPGNASFDNLVVYEVETSLSDLEAHYYDEYLLDDNVGIKANFNKRTLHYEKNRISVPVPKSNSPLILMDDNNVLYRRTTFLDGGRYVIYNKETFEYVEGSTYKINQEDMLHISCSWEESGQPVEVLSFYDEELPDRKTGKTVVTIETPLEAVEDNIVFKYTLNNSYCVNYNSLFHQYEIEMSNSSGSGMYLQFEEPEGLSERMLRNIEFNPFKSTNNAGFIFIENEPRTLETFDIKVTPDSLVADGNDTATISINCYSVGGVPTNNVELDVFSYNRDTQAYGHITRYVSPEEKEWYAMEADLGEEETIKRLGYLTTNEHRSGQFIYKYRAAKITKNPLEPSELNDYVVIRDKISRIGIQVPIRLIRE